MRRDYPQQELYIAQPGGLFDPYGRRINYLRLAVTDRCNLRCRYCMPERGIPFVNHEMILRFEEIFRLIHIFAGLGVDKIRFTGGEPFARKGLMPFLERIAREIPHMSLYITTNGVAAAEHISALTAMGVKGINLSLDTLDPKRFFAISRRNCFDRVWQTFEECLRRQMPLKINTVIQPGVNTDEIVSIAQLARQHPVTVRFIEQMAFNGENAECGGWENTQITGLLRSAFPSMIRVKQNTGTAALYKVPGFKGQLGVIAGRSRHFCATCNKLRITSQGLLKNCLYDTGVADLRVLLRRKAADAEIRQAVCGAVSRRQANGFAAERQANGAFKSSMAAIGG